MTFIKTSYKKGKGNAENNDNQMAFNTFSPNDDMPMKSPEIMRNNIYELLKDHIPGSRFVEVMESKKKRTVVTHNNKNLIDKSIIYQSKKYIYNNSISLKNNVDNFTNCLNITKSDITGINNKTIE